MRALRRIYFVLFNVELSLLIPNPINEYSGNKEKSMRSEVKDMVRTKSGFRANNFTLNNDEDYEFIRELDVMKKNQWPDTLVKSVVDCYVYTMKLSSGEIIRYQSAEFVNEKFVRLFGIDKGESTIIDCGFSRGLDVRVDSIVWIVDAES